MFTDSRKIRIIEAVLKVEDDAVLREVEAALAKPENKQTDTRSFLRFTESFTAEEAAEFEKLIDEGCEKINEDDWK